MKHREPTDEEIALWKKQAQADTVFRPAAPVPVRPDSRRREAHRAASMPPPAHSALPELKAGEVTQMDRRTAQRFHKGRRPADAVLDLHGMRREEAREALHAFIRAQHAKGARNLRVITGKGKDGEGVLRRSLPDWINDPPVRPLVLAYDAAQGHHGGKGAFYILLKRVR
jgi:DNA-nicking Smr family endonuclease